MSNQRRRRRSSGDREPGTGQRPPSPPPSGRPGKAAPATNRPLPPAIAAPPVIIDQAPTIDPPTVIDQAPTIDPPTVVGEIPALDPTAGESPHPDDADQPSTAVLPLLTVVVAVQGSPAAAVRCLAALDRQWGDGIDQLVVVDNSRSGLPASLRDQFPLVEIIRHTDPTLVPVLWGLGYAVSRSPLVALMTDHLEPDTGWVRAMRQAYADDRIVAAGGSIWPAPRLSAVDEAVYWLRYGRFALTGPMRPIQDIAADNGSYRQAALVAFEETIATTGFWEHELNQQLCRHGQRLVLVPAAVAYFHGGVSVVDFARNRLVHGHRYGRKRYAATPGWRRPWLVLMGLLAPPLILARLLGHARRTGGLARLRRALPPLIGLIACWSLGEVSGYLSALLGPWHDQPGVVAP